MTVKLSTGLRNALLGTASFSDIFDHGVIEVRTGPQPVNADAAATGTLLGTITVDAGAFTPGTATNGLTWEAASGGAIAKSASENWKMEGVAAGTAGWFRLKGNGVDGGGSSTSLPRIDGSIGTSGADLNISNIAVTVGAPITIDVFSFALPASA